MAIRYDKQLKNEIYKAVRSFNAKVSRLEKKGVSSALLPDKVSTKGIKANFTERRQLRAYLSSLQDFTSKGQTFRSEGGVTGTTQLFQYNIKRANKATRKLQNEMRNLQSIPTRYPMMKSENVTLLQSKLNYLKRDIYKLDVRQINIYNRNIEATYNQNRRNQVFHQNFKKMMLQVGYRAGLDTNYLASIGDKIDSLPPNKLLELFRIDPAFKMVTERYMSEADIEKSDVQSVYSAIDNSLTEAIVNE